MADIVNVTSPTPGQTRVTFTSSEVGNGSPNDSGTMTNQDGGLAVRLQPEGSDGTPAGAISRYGDEDIVFVAGEGITFDVRDLVSGTARGDLFEVVQLGTEQDDTLTAFAAGRPTYFNGGQGADTITGGTADDFLVGGAGGDTLDGGDGNDSFIGGIGDDTVTGGIGNDTASVNLSTDGADAIDLGAGDDRVNVSTAAGGQVRLSFTSAEVGNGSANDGGTLANQDGGLAVRVQAEDGDGGLTGSVTRADDEGITFVSGTGVTFDVRDLVSGVQRGDQFRTATLGTSGDDSTTGTTSADYVNGGAGADTIVTLDGDDFLVGGAGDDVLIGGLGDDSLLGGAGDDAASVNVSTDGADTIDLGAGLDGVLVSSGTPGQVRLSFTSAEVGNGSATDGGTLANQDGGLAVRMQAEAADGSLTGPVTRADDEGMIFIADEGVTFDVRDLVSGVARGDQFKAAYLGTSADDVIETDAGEAVFGQPVYFNAGQGDDTVTGGIAADFLVGGAGNDTLDGGAGNDSFIGGAGSDGVTGGEGDDTAIINLSTDGADRIDLGAGSDRVNVAAALAGQVRLTFTSAEVGNGNPNDSGALANQDGGLAVRMQLEDADGNLTGPVTRTDDEGITFVAADGVTFDVRDLVSGVARGDQFRTATLGTNAAETLTGTAEADYINGGQGDDVIRTGAGADFLVGGAGNDTLEGGAGNDSFIGGAGDDTYVVDSAGDQITEGSDQGNDRVLSSTSYTLAAGQSIETLQLLLSTGNAALDLTGNEIANTLRGNDGANVLNGAGGADMLYGKRGDDTYIVDDAGDLVFESAGQGNDQILSRTSYTLAAGQSVETLQLLLSTGNTALDLTGNELANTLRGNDGINVLNGGDGADMLYGKRGDDVYIVDNAGDRVFELAGQGNDQVLASTSYTLAAGQSVETLQLLEATGNAALDLTGNEIANTLRGNDGANVLNGAAGADMLYGERGDDTYIVDNAGDRVFEEAGQGNDRILASTSYALAAGQEIETLQLLNATGSQSLNLSGNELANTLRGNNGANFLDGGAGADVLFGRSGADTFVFSTTLGGGNVDTLADFSALDDTIQLSRTVFSGLDAGTLDNDAFKETSATGASVDADDRILYDRSTGALSFDADGSGAGAAVQFATVATRDNLTFQDFTVV